MLLGISSSGSDQVRGVAEHLHRDLLFVGCCFRGLRFLGKW